MENVERLIASIRLHSARLNAIPTGKALLVWNPQRGKVLEITENLSEANSVDKTPQT